MSYDFKVFSHGEPKLELIERFVESCEGASVTGGFTHDENLLWQRSTRTKQVDAFTIDGPVAVENEDVEEQVLPYVLAPKWLVELQVPHGAAAKDRQTARRLGVFLAKELGGAIWDPQEDRALWPRSPVGGFKRPAGQQRIRLVRLEWYLPDTARRVENAELLLRSISRTLPQARPRRFGTYEPLQGKLPPDDNAPFLRQWSESATAEFMGNFSWSSRSPAYGGSVYFSDQREDFRPEGARRGASLSIDLDGRALQDAESRWLDALRGLFVDVAQSLSAFYAAAFVERDVIANRGLWYDGQSENYDLYLGEWWFGLPPKPTWLSWFGPPYADLVADAVPGGGRHGDGLILDLGPCPMDIDEIGASYPALPSELLCRPGDERHWGAADVIPALGS